MQGATALRQLCCKFPCVPATGGHSRQETGACPPRSLWRHCGGHLVKACTSSRLQKTREALLPCGSLLTLDAQRHMRLRQKIPSLEFHLCRIEDMAEKAGMLGDKQRSRKKQREKERRRRKAAAKGIRSKELPEEVTRRLGEANLFYATNRCPFRVESLRTSQYSSILQASLSFGTMPYIAGLAPFLAVLRPCLS